MRIVIGLAVVVFLSTALASSCNGVMNITDSDAFESVAECTSISGRLILQHLTMDSVVLSNLESISGSGDGPTLEIAHNLNTTRIAFPKLTQLQGSTLIYDNTRLQSFEMPMLTEMEEFLITANDLDDAKGKSSSVLLRLDLDALESTKGQVQLYSIGQLNMYVVFVVSYCFIIWHYG
jgi:hypothetical protein